MKRRFALMKREDCLYPIRYPGMPRPNGPHLVIRHPKHIWVLTKSKKRRWQRSNLRYVPKEEGGEE